MTAGSGHVMAAKSILDYFLSYTDCKVEHIDFSKIINPGAKFLYQHSYEFMAKHAHWLWAIGYNLTNFSSLLFILSEKVGRLDGHVGKTAMDILKEREPDIVIFTNPIPSRVLAGEIKKVFGDKCKIATVSTDYDFHRVYIMPEIDYYFASCGEVKYKMMEMGIDKEKIYVSGIPVNPRFYIEQDVIGLKKKHKIDNNLPLVVFITSSLPKRIVKQVSKILFNLKEKTNTVVITGGDKKLYEKIKSEFKADNFQAVNWTDVMDEYMKMSDFIIGKPGGLISSECMAIKKPLVVVGRIAGVEPHNARYMEMNLYGIDASLGNRKKIIEDLILSNNFKLHKNPAYSENPAKNIVETLLQPK